MYSGTEGITDLGKADEENAWWCGMYAS